MVEFAYEVDSERGGDLDSCCYFEPSKVWMMEQLLVVGLLSSSWDWFTPPHGILLQRQLRSLGWSVQVIVGPGWRCVCTFWQ